MRARYYEPQLHRFISPDPNPIDTASALNVNRYNYADNNSYAKSDPSGRCPTNDVPNDEQDDGMECPGSGGSSFFSDAMDTISSNLMALPFGGAVAGAERAAVGIAEEATVVIEEATAVVEEVATVVESTISNTDSFFEGAQYTSKVIEQMTQGAGEFHSFPESVTAFEAEGAVKAVTGSDGQIYQWLEIPGSYQSNSGNWYNGLFQFIKDTSDMINHRLFVPESTP